LVQYKQTIYMLKYPLMGMLSVLMANFKHKKGFT